MSSRRDVSSKREEWIRLMTELAEVDRDEYRRLRAEAWAAIAKAHGRKTADELLQWAEKSS